MTHKRDWLDLNLKFRLSGIPECSRSLSHVDELCFRLAKAQVPLPYVLFAKKGSLEGRRHIHTFLILLPFLCKPCQLSACVCVPVYTHTYTHRQTCVCVYKSIHMSCFPSLYGLEAISFDQLQHSLGDYCSNGKAC